MKRWALVVLAAAAVLAACGQGGGGGTVSAADGKKRLAELPAPYNGADLSNGESRFALCRSCHTIVEGGANMTGPNLRGVFGAKAGAKPGYAYSDALKASGLIWDATTLDRWLAGPQALVPGTKMSFPGLKDPNDRRDVIGYLKVASSAPAS